MTTELLRDLADQTYELASYVDRVGASGPEYRPAWTRMRHWFQYVWSPWFAHYSTPKLADPNTVLGDLHDTIYPSAREAGFPDSILTLPDIELPYPPPPVVATGGQVLTLPEFSACCAVELRAGDQLYVCCAVRDPKTGGARKFERVVDLSGLTRSIAAKMARYHADLHGLPPLPPPDEDGTEPSQEEIEVHFREAGFGPDGVPLGDAPEGTPALVSGPLDFLSSAAEAAQGIATSAATRDLLKQVAPLVFPGAAVLFSPAQKVAVADQVAAAKAGNPVAQAQVTQTVAKAQAGDPQAQALADLMRKFADALDHKEAGGQVGSPSAYQLGVKVGAGHHRGHHGKPNRSAPQPRDPRSVARGRAAQDAKRQRNLDAMQAKLDRQQAALDYQAQMDDMKAQMDDMRNPQPGGGGGGDGGGGNGGGWDGGDDYPDQGYPDALTDDNVWASGTGRSLYQAGLGR